MSECPFKGDVCISQREGVNDIVNGFYSGSCPKISNNDLTELDYDSFYEIWSISIRPSNDNSTVAVCLNKEDVLDCEWYIYDGLYFVLDQNISTEECSNNTNVYYNYTLNGTLSNSIKTAPTSGNLKYEITCSNSKASQIIKTIQPNPENIIFLFLITLPICYFICWIAKLAMIENLKKKHVHTQQLSLELDGIDTLFDKQRLDNFERCGTCTSIDIFVRSCVLSLGIATIIYTWIIPINYENCSDDYYLTSIWTAGTLHPVFQIITIFGWFAVWVLSVRNQHKKSYNPLQKCRKYIIHMIFVFASTSCAIIWFLSIDIGNVSWINLTIIDKCACRLLPKFMRELESDTEYYDVFDTIIHYAAFGMGIVTIVSCCMICDGNWFTPQKQQCISYIALFFVMSAYCFMIIATAIAQSLSLVYSVKLLFDFGIELEWNDILFIVILISTIIYNIGEWWNSRKQRKQKEKDDNEYKIDNEVEMSTFVDKQNKNPANNTVANDFK